MIKHVAIQITGRVQGVFFRQEVLNQAKQLSLTGFVRNNDDGSVSIEAEGDEAALHALVNWCKVGPELAEVENVKVHEGEMMHFKGFEIQ